MWARTLEMAVGVWLTMSAFTFAVPGAADAIVVPLAGGVAVLLIALWSRRARHAHLFVLLVALVLIVWGWARFPRPGPPAAQNAMLVGLVLGLFSIVPNEADKPPPAWRRYVRESD